MERPWDLIWFTSSHIKSSAGVGSLVGTIGLWKATESADLVVMTVWLCPRVSHHGGCTSYLFESDEI